MKAVLNLRDALELASILSKYVDVKELNPDTDALEFISGIVQKISPTEYLQCVMLTTKEDVETIKKKNPIDILTAFIEGLKANKIVSLLEFYKQLGF